ncbi:MAG: hypothetical protein A2008_00685 [Candidatus Wallbacteria bacterium GWC2_49_35]|uniref:Phage tail protein n=1 Tax=Candidatus Wallbacteria bacterium GWC2_49_35 TaxID=1817813 RepID=A0A1F7WYS2_9BACT|nr:MAG: hypothetical protein A2008_00685 [Candidatus Wallbacteria bacterium GWC2_49_35]HBC74254.1 hypothetical protein [Candidatus Wallbacteria bacterium]
MATAINWPTSIKNPVYPLSEGSEDGVIRSQFENGVEQTRRRFTRQRKDYTLKWTRMSATDKSTFDTFYDTTTAAGSLSFNWTHPITNVTKEYRFVAPPRRDAIDYNWYYVDCQIREV